MDEIVEAIAKNKTGGTGLKGTVEGTYIETLQKPNGDEYDIIHEMRFDRPVEVPLFITLTVTRKVSADPVDIELIKQKLADRVFGINENAEASDLYETVKKAGTNFVATDLQVSDDNITFTDGLIQSAPDEKFTIATTDITVTEIIP